MSYKYLALDLDGTLTNSQKEVTPYTIETLKRAAERGVHIILASGRPELGIFPVADAIHLKEIGGYILAYNGSRIIDYKTGEDILKRSVPTELYQDICESYHRFDIAALTYNEGKLLTEEPEDKYVQLEARINRTQPQHVPSLYDALTEPVCKFLALGEHEKLKKFQKYLKEKHGNKLNVFFSETVFLEIVPPGIEKAASLEVLLKLLGGSPSELIACGDGLNDITMIDYAGLGVAMENAQAPLLERADYITDSNDRDGVAEVIRKFILEEDVIL